MFNPIFIKTNKILQKFIDISKYFRYNHWKGGGDMKRSDFVLAVLSVANGAPHTPVQVQKLFFLIDKKIPELVGGPHFKHTAYDYGPFDVAVYNELSSLEDTGDLETLNTRVKQYRLTKQGQINGEIFFNSIDSKAQEYIKRLSEFVRSLSFAQLVSAIYEAYPDMRENSVFRG